MVGPSNRSYSDVTRSILPACSIHGMWGSRNTSCDGLANKKQSVYLPRCLCTVVTVSELVCFILIDSTLVK